MVRSFCRPQTEAGRERKVALLLPLWLRRSRRRYLGFVAFAAPLWWLVPFTLIFALAVFFFFYGPIFDFLSIRFFLFYSTNQVAQVKSGDNVFHFLDPNWETFGGKKKNWYKFGLIFNFWKSLPIFL
jgi:hypothetical protein